MNRHAIITRASRRSALGWALGALLWPGPSRPQERMARVGWLTLQSSGRYEELTAQGFIAGLREAGFVEGKNLELVKRSADGDLRRLGPLAKEIVAVRVDVFFAPAKPMADAAWYASRRIPTVIATVTDPVRVDYAESLARPGKHITGVTTANAELIGKRLQLLTEMVPGARRVGTFIDPALLASCSEEVDLMDQSAKALGLSLVRIEVAAGKDFDAEAALQRAVAAKVQAVVTAPMTSNQDLTARLAEQSTLHRLPFVHDVPQLAGEALAVYGPDFQDIYRRAGLYVARILKGEKPAEMAIEEPQRFRLIVNARAARSLGITLPQAVLLRADEVIQ
jgi:putative tryptophan/tyrosine transport system substrate-binding protein